MRWLSNENTFQHQLYCSLRINLHSYREIDNLLHTHGHTQVVVDTVMFDRNWIKLCLERMNTYRLNYGSGNKFYSIGIFHHVYVYANDGARKDVTNCDGCFFCRYLPWKKAAKHHSISHNECIKDFKWRLGCVVYCRRCSNGHLHNRCHVIVIMRDQRQSEILWELLREKKLLFSAGTLSTAS